MKRTFHLILITLLIVACNHKTDKFNIPDEFSSTFRNNQQSKKDIRLICFFDGNCSFCYAILKALSEEFATVPIIAVSNSTDTVLINFNLDKINFNGALLTDPHNKCFFQNLPLTKAYKIFLLKKERIIAKYEFTIDKKMKNKFHEAIKQITSQE
jgi:hypothetical protein